MFTNKSLLCGHISSDFVWGVCVYLPNFKMPGDENKKLTDEQRRNMLWFLQQRASAENKNGLKRNAMKDAAIHFECSAKCVQRLWKRAQVNRGKVESKIKGTSGRKRIGMDTAMQKLQPSD